MFSFDCSCFYVMLLVNFVFGITQLLIPVLKAQLVRKGGELLTCSLLFSDDLLLRYPVGLR